jgi:Rrf2 family transcriptional regulator, nitric oxide-sensitive transcriptional repressor
MKLTTFTDYSLRSLIQVALSQDKLITTDEIAQSNRISRHHVTKVIAHLNKIGYLETLRGKGGGIRLAMRPELITIGRLVRQTETDLSLLPCGNGQDNSCVILPVCKLISALDNAREAFFATLDKYTLADFLEPRRKLMSLFSISDGNAPYSGND